MVARSKSDPRLMINLLFMAVFVTVSGLVFVSTSCRSPSASASTIQIGMRLVTEKRMGLAVVEATVRGPDDQSVKGARVSLRGDMNHAGMKPVIVSMREVSTGTYLADDFQFTMGGDWLLTVEAVLPNGEKAERTFDVPGVPHG